MPWFWRVGFTLGVVVGVFLIRGALATHSPGGDLFAVLIVVVLLANPALAFLGRRRARTSVASRGWEDRRTGKTLNPGPRGPWPVGGLGRPVKWVGGANLAGPVGRVNATWPFGTLKVNDADLALAVVAGRLYGLKPLSARASDVDVVFPVRGWLGTVGVAIRLPAVPDSYFWTRRRREVLGALAAADFPVSWEEEQRARIW